MRRLDEFLIDLERDALVHVLSELVARHPELQPEAEVLCEAAQAVWFRGRPLPPVNLAEVQGSLRTGFRAAGARRLGGICGSAAAEIVSPWIKRAGKHLAAGDSASALDLLAVVADELAETRDAFRDQGGDFHHCLQELGRRLSQALRTASLTPEDRAAWQTRLQAWRSTLGDAFSPELPAPRPPPSQS